MSGGGTVSSNAPRDSSTASWSVGATATDSPGRYSLNESSKGISVTRGDSLAYSDDSQDTKAFMNRSSKAHHTQTTSRAPARMEALPVFKQPRAEQKVSIASLNDSQMTEESIRDRNKTACCVVQ